MAKTTKFKYFKLGANSSVFFCSRTNVKVLESSPAKISTIQLRDSKKLTVAIANKHLIEITQEEFNGIAAKDDDSGVDVTAGETTAADLKKLNKDQLFTYYKDNYEVDDDDEEEFNAKSKADMVSYILELEKDSE